MADILPPVRVCCGQRHNSVACPDGRVMCQICFARVEIEQLGIDAYGDRIDVCAPCLVEEQAAAITRLSPEGRPRVHHIYNHTDVTLCGVRVTWDADHMAVPDAPDCPVCASYSMDNFERGDDA